MRQPPVYKSRKFWAALAGIAFAVFGPRGGLDEQSLIGALGIIATYIIGTALEGLRPTQN